MTTQGFTHTIAQGDCLTELAEQHGLFPKTIWDHERNRDLKRLREDLNILHPGDEIFIPAIRIKSEDRQTEQRHRFKRKGVPAKLRVRLMALEEPHANTRYEIKIDAIIREGQTDGDGMLDEWIPCGAQTARVKLFLESREEIYVFDLGNQNPIDEPSGVQQRLKNLGFACEETGAWDEQTKAALKSFQNRYELDPTGNFDSSTRGKLLEIHGT